MSAQALVNLAAYSAQVLCVAALGGLLAAIVRIDRPAFRYLYWRLVLAVCLALPWMQEWHVVSHVARDSTSTTVTTLTAAAAAAVTPVAAVPGAVALPAPDWPAVVGGILIGGMALRLAWLALGLLRLRHLRSAGMPAQLSADDERLRAALAPQASVRDVEGLSQPVTFGLWRPVVLLPLTLREHDPAIRRAVLCHELLHARRRDWLWVLLEEGVRGALWFHPATWWLIARLQLAREEVVDEGVVRTIGARRTYVEALLLFADDAPVMPAAAFARRRHLFRRIELIAKERAMSLRRLVLSGCVMAATMALVTWHVSQTFPLSAALPQQVLDEPGPLEKSARAITPENPIPRRTAFAAPRYPADVTTGAPAAVVNMLLTIDASGHPAEVRAVGISVSSATPGLSFAVARQPLQVTLAQMAQTVPNTHASLLPTSQAFIREATLAVSQWAYDPPASGPLSLFVQALFTPGSPAAAAQASSDPGLPRPAASLDRIRHRPQRQRCKKRHRNEP